MDARKKMTAISSGISLLLLIVDSKRAVIIAQEGVELCIRTVIPSLFPFLVLMPVLSSALTVPRWLGCAVRTLGIPEGASSLLIPAFLGGYPVGAKCVHELYQGGQLSKRHAERLLSFSSNAGPAFLFGMVSVFFTAQRTWLLWMIHIASALLTAAVLSSPGQNTALKTMDEEPVESDYLLSAMKAMASICGWVILFRILTGFLQAWCLWLLPQWLQILITGLLELTNGCCSLGLIADEKLRFILASCMLAFGGLCVLMQTASVTNVLSLRYYLMGKGIQMVFSFLLSWAVISGFGWYFAAGIPILCVIVRKFSKSSGNPRVIPV